MATSFVLYPGWVVASFLSGVASLYLVVQLWFYGLHRNQKS